jgi:galactonate dehydratase
MERNAAALVEEGYTALKVKVGFGPAKDAANVRAIRKLVGPQIALYADANSAYDAGDAVWAGKAFQEEGVLWFEEPVPPDDFDGYRRVRDKLDMKIAAGESEFSVYGFRDFLRDDCLDIVQPDVARCGGISECRRVAHLADAFGKGYSPHTGFSSSICILASLQLAAWAPNFVAYEHMVLDNPLQRILDMDPPKVCNGKIAVPQAPGLGAALNEDLLARYRLD